MMGFNVRVVKIALPPEFRWTPLKLTGTLSADPKAATSLLAQYGGVPAELRRVGSKGVQICCSWNSACRSASQRTACVSSSGCVL